MKRNWSEIETNKFLGQSGSHLVLPSWLPVFFLSLSSHMYLSLRLILTSGIPVWHCPFIHRSHLLSFPSYTHNIYLFSIFSQLFFFSFLLQHVFLSLSIISIYVLFFMIPLTNLNLFLYILKNPLFFFHSRSDTL